MPWRLQSIRFSAFPPPGADEWQVPSWQTVMGGDPENRVSPQPGIRLEDGPFGRGRMAVHRQLVLPLRADLVYAAGPQPGSAEPPLIGTLEDAVEILRPVVARFLGGAAPALGRIALATELYEPVGGIDEAVQLLGQRIDPARFDLRGVRDFGYQINRRQPSAIVPELLINRIAKWTLGMWGTVSVNPGTGQVETEGNAVWAASLDTDVNTGAEYPHALPGEHRLAVFDELVNHTQALATRGDV